MIKEKNINILTGQLKKQYPTNSKSRRFQSQSQMKKAHKNGQYNQPISSIRKLGTASDSKLFNYSYQNNDNRIPILKNRVNTQEDQRPKDLIQSIIDKVWINKQDIKQYIQQWNQANRRAPISKYVPRGRVNVANYNKQFREKLQKNKKQFNKRNEQSDMCQIEKSYGGQKLFKEFK